MDKESVIEIGRSLLIALAVIAAFLGLWWLMLSRAKTILREWAAEGGFQILGFEKKYMIGTGPFKWWTNSRNKIIYHVRVRDSAGRERSAWVRCGSTYGGVLFSRQAEVRWDET
ncbi:MAG: hypothetical protein JWM68_5798 [Verrucomicrobiales bacterium]|nr:hypothetical protein [Verrucomicrobiales bacterium]